MVIPVSNRQPSKPGLYVAFFPSTASQDFVWIVDTANGLDNPREHGTHFSRWKCLWSEPIEIVRTP